MRFWPWSVLAEAKRVADLTKIDRTAAEGALTKAGNLWREAHEDLRETGEMLSTADYRFARGDDETVADYKDRMGKALHDGRTSAVALIILDRLDSKTREAFTLWLTAKPDESEVLRQRASALADFRSELVAALYMASPGQRRAEAHRRIQEHSRIYLDVKQAQENGRGA